MPRQVRIQYPGAIHHVMAHGDRREAIFRDDLDRRTFLAVLEEACGRTGWLCHAYVLMGNHYHMVLRSELFFRHSVCPTSSCGSREYLTIPAMHTSTR